MKSWELERIYREEGREEGRKEARLEGLEQGTSALIKTCREFPMSREATLAKVLDSFMLEQNAAEVYMQKYWQE